MDNYKLRSLKSFTGLFKKDKVKEPIEYKNKDVTIDLIEDILLEYIEHSKCKVRISDQHGYIHIHFEIIIPKNINLVSRYNNRFAETIVKRLESFNYNVLYDNSKNIIDHYGMSRGRFTILVPKF